jgi:hypothetical protein
MINYQKETLVVLRVSAKLLENFFNEDSKEIPNSVIDSISKNKF